MISTSPQKVQSLLVGALIGVYFTVLFLSPWTHRHPEEDHARVDGEGYHTHLPSPAPSPPENESDDPYPEEMAHLLAGDSPSLEAIEGFGFVA